MEENKKNISKLEKILSNLIADEWITTQLYLFWDNMIINTFCPEANTVTSIRDVLDSIRIDEFDDHYKSLVKVSISNGLSVPKSFRDILKYASEDMQKMFSKNKKTMSLLEIIDAAIAAEDCAIISYQKALDFDFIHTRPDIFTVVNGIYFDELEHFDRLSFIKATLEMNDSYIIDDLTINV